MQTIKHAAAKVCDRVPRNGIQGDRYKSTKLGQRENRKENQTRTEKSPDGTEKETEGTGGPSAGDEALWARTSLWSHPRQTETGSAQMETHWKRLCSPASGMRRQRETGDRSIQAD
jgi:hypothetical protein